MLTSLYKTIYSGDSQEGWIINDTEIIPTSGFTVVDGQEVNVTLYPMLSDFVAGDTYYIAVDVWDGSSFISYSDGYTFISNGNSLCFANSKIPMVRNFALVFVMEDGARHKLNIT
jgi:hypothetical protein